jgi:DNA repair protein RecO (recombination protein O)
MAQPTSAPWPSRGSRGAGSAGARRAATLSDRALCLRRVPYGDSSLVVEVLTAAHGRVGLLARGAYRTNSRFCGVLDYFHRLELTWRPAPSGGLGLLIAGDRDHGRRRIAEDLWRYRSALGCLELAEWISRSGQPEAGLFALLDDCLELLERGSDGSAVGLRFDLLALAELGLAPALRRCGGCGRRATPASDQSALAWFCPAAGGRLCPMCLPAAPPAGRYKTSAWLLEHLAELAGPLSGPLGPWSGAEPARQLLDRFLEQHLESRPRTLQARLSAGARPAD